MLVELAIGSPSPSQESTQLDQLKRLVEENGTLFNGTMSKKQHQTAYMLDIMSNAQVTLHEFIDFYHTLCNFVPSRLSERELRFIFHAAATD